ncbi:MAG: hypothetical protein KGZ41_06050 [Dethiobacter sp.]|nr:hypothetical protein [Dethiobacter sp.]MBS3983344.1 hypothetical protein [Dethiobacter sp.]MCL4462500.1 hypothetical protein [Bacillota bacterium]MCL5993273.1 hypothetical protein [Bacillota bacterium]
MERAIIMLVSSFSYTLQHILLLKLLSTFTFSRPRTVHNFFFLATLSCPAAERAGHRYDFYKGASAVYSFELQNILTDLNKGGMICPQRMVLTREGREYYYQLASLLRYEQFPAHCMKLALRYQDNLWRVNHEVLFHPLFRKGKSGRKIIMPLI